MQPVTNPTPCPPCLSVVWPSIATTKVRASPRRCSSTSFSRQLEVAELTGLRLVLVHAQDSHAAGFYRHFGFEPSPFDDLTLMLLIKDIHP